jgi:phospholipase/lecithinase/hemolysin
MKATWFSLFLFLLCATPGPSAVKKPYSMLYVFGDSYSDTGAGYIDGNGPTAVAYMAERLNIPFTRYGDPNGQGKGLNFAVSGAKSGAGDGKRFEHGELLGFGMQNQVAEFAALVKSGAIHFDPRRTMFFLAGGLNDRDLPQGVTVSNIEAEIAALRSLGARRFSVALLPTKIPAFAAVGQRLNPQLARIPSEMHARFPDIRIASSNWGLFFDEVLENPTKYNLTNTTSRCAGRALVGENPTPCANPDTYFYFHEGHPSTAVHKAVGEMLYQEAVHESATQ